MIFLFNIRHAIIVPYEWRKKRFTYNNYIILIFLQQLQRHKNVGLIIV